MAASLVVQTSYLGDVILTTPLLARLAERGPVDVVTTRAAAPLLMSHPAVREVLVYDKRGAASGVGGLWRTARRLRARAARDRRASAEAGRRIAYLAQGSLRSATLALLAGYRERVGFDRSAGRALYTRTVRYREEEHHAARLWRLGAEPQGRADPVADEPGGDQPVPPEALRPRLYPGPADVEAADALLRDAGHDGAPLLALAPGSAWRTKRWPYFPDLAALLAADGQRIVVVGDATDRAAAQAIRAAGGGATIDATGALSLLATAELIGRCTVVVTNDSAPQHLASAMGTPTVTLFGPTVPAFGFGPLAPHHATAGVATLPCRPCDRHGPMRCPLGHWRCMRDLTAGEVAGLARDLARTPAAR